MKNEIKTIKTLTNALSEIKGESIIIKEVDTFKGHQYDDSAVITLGVMEGGVFTNLTKVIICKNALETLPTEEVNNQLAVAIKELKDAIEYLSNEDFATNLVELIEHANKAIEETGLDFDIRFTSGGIIKEESKERIGFSMTGTHVEGRYIKIEEVTISLDIKEDEFKNLMDNITGFQLAYDLYPMFKGLDMSDDEALLQRSAYMMVNNLYKIEDAYNTARTKLQGYVLTKADCLFDRVLRFRTVVKRGLYDGTIKTDNHMYVPTDNNTIYNIAFKDMDDAVQELTEMDEILRDAIMNTLKELVVEEL